MQIQVSLVSCDFACMRQTYFQKSRYHAVWIHSCSNAVGRGTTLCAYCVCILCALCAYCVCTAYCVHCVHCVRTVCALLLGRQLSRASTTSKRGKPVTMILSCNASCRIGSLWKSENESTGARNHRDVGKATWRWAGAKFSSPSSHMVLKIWRCYGPISEHLHVRRNRSTHRHLCLWVKWQLSPAQIEQARSTFLLYRSSHGELGFWHLHARGKWVTFVRYTTSTLSAGLQVSSITACDFISNHLQPFINSLQDEGFPMLCWLSGLFGHT